ncbi:MAG: heavy metal translocating P-type ATPase [Rhodocyclaceae bacterium]|nr:heavy metal translocating P-type ATPase [Rhodocyclaceae bacterium]MCA3038366.1 heavy metal translocating P-type ATPase [Rhodocyclaceae bacterium]MCA3041119.1 heavy metal translocating P-type ATPase [Rhodocyclaceae bacterium]MCA3047649.1 heavy metal translocating P-type ATPase [Rhodocyclaceae bacterium]MCA3050302.1 heavy metal translocating P-type ATPase [Rhodocyclaceae bacterium]
MSAHDHDSACCAPPTNASLGESASLPIGAKELRLKIQNMDCPTEEALVRKAIGGLPGVVALEFDLINRILTVGHTLTNAGSIDTALRSIGMAGVPLAAGKPGATTVAADEHQAASISKRQWILMTVAGIAAISAEVVAYTTGNETSIAVALLALIAIFTGGVETLKKGWIALKTFTLNINLLMSVAVIGAVAIGQWPEAAVVIWLFGIAEMIEVLSLDRARNAIRALMANAPETAFVQQADGAWSEVPADQVAVGLIVRVRPGERIALDGIVVSGQSGVNQAPITGESIPVEKTVGATLFAGSLNERGVLEFRVTAATGETTLDRIAKSIQAAQGQRAPTQRFVDKFARVYTPVVFVLAVLVAIVPPLAFGMPWYDWIYKALVLLVIACPCALVISTPVTIVSGLTAAARRGILIKGGTYLEQGRELKTVALDKTGTITHGKPVLTDVVALASMSKEESLRIAASLDTLSDHPVATAIVGGYKGSVAAVEKFEALHGRGVKGTLEGVTYFVGNHRLMEELKVCSSQLEEALDRLEIEAKTAIVLSTDKETLAIFAVADTIRDTSKVAIAELKSLGIEAIMLTGDNDKTAKAVAAQVGIADARGNMMPDDKLAAIETFLERGLVGMVGDGVNDAPALARSSIGFAMGAAGTDTAIETADVALMQDDLRKLPEFIRLSKKTSQVLWQNIVFALGIKAVFFALTLTGQGTLWMAVFADAGASLIVVANGLRLLQGATRA